MNSDFVTEQAVGIEYQVYKTWNELGYVHGFVGCTSLTEDQLLDSIKIHKPDLKLVPIKQSHSNFTKVVSVENYAIETESDAVSAEHDSGYLLYLKTADCLPIICRSDRRYLLIHAGWRGLANAVIEESFKASNLIGDTNIQVLIGPCAGADKYEVGMEVIESIGESAVYQNQVADKACLDLVATACNQLKSLNVSSSAISTISICTISDSNFYSYRRNRIERARNIAFVVT